MSMKVRKQPMRLQDMAALLADGESFRTLCPFCAGGSSREESFSIKRSGSIANWICYRASCGSRGRIGYGGVTPVLKTQKQQQHKVRRFSGATFQLPIKYSQYFKVKFNIQPAMLREYRVRITRDGRVLFPILDPSGVARGDNIRLYPELVDPNKIAGVPKSKIYIPENTVTMSWHRLCYTPSSVNRTGRSPFEVPGFFPGLLVIVEDQVSAIKASRLVDCAALLGTNLNADKIMEVVKELGHQNVYEKVVILLDADAYDVAIRHIIRYRALLPGIAIRKLHRDLKDTPYMDMVELLNGVYDNGKQCKDSTSSSNTLR